MILSTNALLIAALIKIESSGNDLAIGDQGKARGPLQVRQEVLHDVNRTFGTRYKLDQMHDRQKAAEVFDRYQWIYARPEKLGRKVTDTDRARIWNGGPMGWKRDATLQYAKKFSTLTSK